MPPVDWNAVYPIGTVLIVLVMFLLNFRIFATPKDLADLKTEIAEKYTQKEDFKDALTEFRNGLDEFKTDIKRALERIFDKLDIRQ